MKRKAVQFERIIIVVAMFMFVFTALTGAQTKREERIHRRAERVVVKTPVRYNEVIVKDRHYYFRSGAFYERRANVYAVVPAPIGAKITILPAGYRIIHLHRKRFYFFAGVYYKYIPREKVFVVIEKPL